MLTGPEAVLASVKTFPARKPSWPNWPAARPVSLPLDERRLFDRLIEREGLGSTGIGGGIAIPHGRMAAIAGPHGLFARLGDRSLSTRSTSGRLISFFLLVAPEGAGADHLKALARVSRLLRDHSLVDKLRATESADALYALAGRTVPGAERGLRPCHVTPA